MELSVQQQKQYKQLLLATMKAFLSLCNEYNLRYIAAYGTVLGAVRHKGLIPWDDDIDVYMLRDDYEKFISLKDKIRNSDYYIVDFHDKGYYLPYAKFCDANSTIWEKKEQPFIIGVFIDVFPLDEVDDLCSEKLFWEYRLEFQHYYNSVSSFSSFYWKHPRLLTQWLFDNIKYFINPNRLWKIESKITKIRGNRCMYYRSSIPNFKKSVYKKDYFQETIEWPFEDFSIIIPRDFDGYLKQEYGNYMELPPIENRISQHYHYFFDLTTRYTLSDCKKMIKE